MKLGKLAQLVAGNKKGMDIPYQVGKHVAASLPRWLALCGVELPDLLEYQLFQSDIEIDMSVASQVLAIDQSERMTADLRAMGEGIGRCSINVPSNVNVWQHLKGEGVLSRAAESLAAAAKQIAVAAEK